MDPLHDLIARRLDNFGLTEALTATAILESANRILPADIRAKTFSRGILAVEARDSASAYFFKHDQDDYIERFNAALGDKKITGVRIRISHDD